MATNQVLERIGTAKVFTSSGGDGAITFGGKATTTGRRSTVVDFGASPRARLYRWFGTTTLQATPTVGRSVGVYLIPWDDESGTPGNGWGGQSGTTDADFNTRNDLLGLFKVGDIVVHAAAAGVVSKGGVIRLPARNCQLVLWNETGATTNATSSLTIVKFWPLVPDIQAAA